MDSLHDLRELYPHLAETELLLVAETLRRYVDLAAETTVSAGSLTTSFDRVNVRVGAVDPGTFKTTPG
jgi:hypothetical protein